jgi:hypothetical protein
MLEQVLLLHAGIWVYLLAYFSVVLLANLSSQARNSSVTKFCYVQQRNSHRQKSVTRVSEIMSNRRYLQLRGEIQITV